jgi:hypothetical protein
MSGAANEYDIEYLPVRQDLLAQNVLAKDFDSCFVSGPILMANVW